MKITLLGTAYPYRGGLASFNERLGEEFILNGHDFNIETFTVQYPNFLFPGKTQFADWKQNNSIKINRSVNSVNPFNWLKIGNKLKKQKPDLLIIKYWMPFMAPCFGSISRIVKKNKHTKIICIVDNIIPHEKRAFDKILTRYFVKPIDGFIAMSKSVEKEIPIFSNKKIIFNPHPIFDNFGKSINKDLALKNLDLDSSFKYILFFGIIRDYKGLDLLLEAFASDKLEKLNLKLIVAGEFYNNEKKYIELINTLNLNSKIILKNHFIPDNEVVNYFCAADIIVQPYKSATQSGVTQIAYNFEKPMIVTNVGGLPEIVPHKKAGYVVNVNKEEITDSIFEFFNNNMQDEFKKTITNEKERFSWSNMCNNILKL